MKLIIFDIYGKFAHFRKFYTNSSSLTYGIPPRTTVAGIVAAMMGYERDSYYEIFNSDKLRIGVKKMNKTSRIIQTLNYSRATSMGELIKGVGPTQVPFEVLKSSDKVKFRIYLYHEDGHILDEIERRSRESMFVYPPYLGSASFGCSISYIDTVEFEEVKTEDFISISTAINSESIVDLNIKNYSGSLVKERMAVDFDKDRNIKDISSYIYDDQGKSIEIKTKDKVVKLLNGEYITFM